MRTKSFIQHHFWRRNNKPANFLAKKSDGEGLPSTTLFKKSGAGFTLIEILAALAIISIISSFIIVSLKSYKAKARDVKRIQEVTEIVKALQLYWMDHNQYPTSTCPCEKGGYNEQWEASDEKKKPDWFLAVLNTYFNQDVPIDSINIREDKYEPFGFRGENYFYAYRTYYATSSFCSELLNKRFVVIGIKNLETYVSSDLPQENMPLPLNINLPRATCGNPGPEGICTVQEARNGQCRDWSQEFDYSIMLID